MAQKGRLDHVAEKLKWKLQIHILVGKSYGKRFLGVVSGYFIV
jgi:hypothetical protein